MLLRRWVGATQHATSLNTTTKSRFSEMSRPLEIIPLNQLPLLKKGDDLAGIIVSRAKKLGVGIRNRDLVVIGQKAVSKAEGRIIDITDVSPSVRAIEIAKKTRSEEHTSELQSPCNLVCRLLLEKKKKKV